MIRCRVYFTIEDEDYEDNNRSVDVEFVPETKNIWGQAERLAREQDLLYRTDKVTGVRKLDGGYKND